MLCVKSVSQFVLVVLIMVALGLISRVPAATPEENMTGEIPNFSKIDTQHADAAAKELVRRADVTNRALMGQLENATTENGKLYPIYLLGEFREERTIDLLLDNLDFVPTHFDPRFNRPRWSNHPAQEALEKIGLQSVGAVVDKLKFEDNQNRRTLMVGIMTDLEGSKITKMRIQDLLATTTDSKVMKRLNDCLILVDAQKVNHQEWDEEGNDQKQ